MKRRRKGKAALIRQTTLFYAINLPLISVDLAYVASEMESVLSITTGSVGEQRLVKSQLSCGEREIRSSLIQLYILVTRPKWADVQVLREHAVYFSNFKWVHTISSSLTGPLQRPDEQHS